MTVYKFEKTDTVEVTSDGIRYKVSNSWGGTFVMLDLEPGTYKSDAKVSLCTQKVGEYWSRNQYYSEKLGEAYACETGGQPFSISENAKLGFSLPQGEGVARTSIVRIL